MSITEQFFNKNAKTQQLSRSAQNFCDRSKLDFFSPQKIREILHYFLCLSKKMVAIKVKCIRAKIGGEINLALIFFHGLCIRLYYFTYTVQSL